MRRSLAPVVVLAVVLPTLALLPPAGSDPSTAVTGSWTILPPVPLARTEVTAAAVAGKVYVIGGLGPQAGDGTRVDIFDPATNTWAQGPSLPFAIHHTQAVTIMGRFVLVLGGYGPGTAFQPLPLTWLLDASLPLAAQQWAPFVPLPEPRGAHAAATDGAAVYLYGGVGIGGHVATAWKMEGLLGQLTIPVWVPIANFPSPRDHLAGGFLDGKAYAAGGRVASNTNRLDIYDPVANTWTQGPGMPTARGGNVAASAAGHLWVFGGESLSGGFTFNQAEGYSPASNAWTSVPPMPHSRHGLGAAAIGNHVYVEAGGPIAGFTYSGHNERLTLT